MIARRAADAPQVALTVITPTPDAGPPRPVPPRDVVLVLECDNDVAGAAEALLVILRASSTWTGDQVPTAPANDTNAGNVDEEPDT